MEAAAAKAKEFKETPSTVMKVHAPRRRSCYRCGRNNHDAKECRFREAKCHNCGKVGHIAPACRAPKKVQPKNPSSPHQNKPQAKFVEVEPEPVGDSPAEDLALFTVGAQASNPIEVALQINDRPLTMELDTGADVSIVSEKTYRTLLPGTELKPLPVPLRTYTGEQMKVLGQIPVTVRYERVVATDLPLVVVAGDGPSLLGRNWLKHIRLNWKKIGTVVLSGSTAHELSRLLQDYQEIFADELGTVQMFQAELTVQENAQPKFCKPRSVPLPMKEAIEEELDRLERIGVLEKVAYSRWATPLVCVPKKDGRVRLCGDYKVTLNQVLNVEQYLLPKPDDLFATLAGGERFTVLDLTQAYQQLLLDDNSRQYVTVNTHRGLYRYTRLPYGVASAPAIFQRVMDTILQGLPGVICYIDDILITGSNDKEHLRNLERVFRQLQRHGIRLKKPKCAFLQPSVEYLGHQIDAEGRRATKEKLQAILQAPSPKNVQELRSFLGLLNYYGKFIPNLATLIHPLNALLHHDCPWKWSVECDAAFNQAKEKLISSKILVHYDPKLPIKVAADASAYGVGAVLSHVIDGNERPIAFARTLTASERNYAQVEKEALGLIFAVKKFHTYIYGREFTLVTDHKPLTTILGPKQGIPPLAAARLQRWAILLSAYKYQIEFRSTTAHGNADCLSRLPLSDQPLEGLTPEPSIFNLSQIASLPVTSSRVETATRNDPVLSKVLQYTSNGWPSKVDESLLPYWRKRLELTVEQGCILWGIRVVVPEKLRIRLLEELHHDHPGIMRMKSVARSYFWWPHLDKAIEELVKSCRSCQEVKHAPAAAPLHPWVWPTKPWQRVHVDFAGPFQGNMFLLAVDAHSKWPEVFVMQSTTTNKTIEVLRHLFAAHGIPEQVVTDNGPQFVADEFASFLKGNGVKHIRTIPYHPASNGLVERFVQSFKQALRASQNDGRSLNNRLSTFLLTYRSTQHATTGVPPCTLFLRRRLRTRFDLLKPNCEERVLEKQAKQKEKHDPRTKGREWHVGQSVMVRNLRPGPNWVPGVIVERAGPLSYVIETEDKQIWRRHVDQLKELGDGVAMDNGADDSELTYPPSTPAANDEATGRY